MDDFKDLLSNSLPIIPKELIPMVALGLIILSLVLVLILFIMCVTYINSQPKPKVVTPLKRDDLIKKKEETYSVPKHVISEDLPPIAGRIGEILSLWGILKVGPITQAFFKAIDAIRSSTYDLRWRYKLPCLMMMWKIFKKGAIFEMQNPMLLKKNLHFGHS